MRRNIILSRVERKKRLPILDSSSVLQLESAESQNNVSLITKSGIYFFNYVLSKIKFSSPNQANDKKFELSRLFGINIAT